MMVPIKPTVYFRKNSDRKITLLDPLGDREIAVSEIVKDQALKSGREYEEINRNDEMRIGSPYSHSHVICGVQERGDVVSLDVGGLRYPFPDVITREYMDALKKHILDSTADMRAA